MTEAAWGDVIAIVAILAIAAILIVIIWQLFESRQARAALTREEEFKKLTERATAAQERTVQELSAASANLTDLKSRVTEIERIIKEVE